jgi:hypothetical protein
MLYQFKGMFGTALLRLYQLYSINSTMEQLHCEVSECFFICLAYRSAPTLELLDFFIGIVLNAHLNNVLIIFDI